MEVIQLITIIVGGGGIAGFVGTVYQVRKNASTANANTEVEAAAQENINWDKLAGRFKEQLEYQDKQIEKLRSEVADLRKDRIYDREHILLLQRQIYAGIGPPPLKPGDVFPDDQIGG